MYALILNILSSNYYSIVNWMPDGTTASAFQDKSCPQRLQVKSLNAYLWLHVNNDKGCTINVFYRILYISARYFDKKKRSFLLMNRTRLFLL